GLRVERLQDISEADALAEGVHTDDDYPTNSHCPKCKGSGLHGSVGQHGGFEEVDCQECNSAIKRFSHLWDSTGGNWAANPWVWVIEFKVLTTNGVVPEVAA
ncbi:MAG: hypothetical protein K2W88_17490, partial [Pararheinheimera sp.]|nr:hypothetical protein [Rheinheimera sp.]